MLLLHYQSHTLKKIQTPQQVVYSPSFPFFYPFLCSSGMFLKLLEALESPGDTIAMLILIQ